MHSMGFDDIYHNCVGYSHQFMIKNRLIHFVESSHVSSNVDPNYLLLPKRDGIFALTSLNRYGSTFLKFSHQSIGVA